MTPPFANTSFPEIYERALVGPIFRPWAEALLDDVRLGPGDRVLDVACGTGIVARLARERLRDGGIVVGIDASPAMLTVARRLAPEVDWREGSADALPVGADERFDVVACQQGIQFFPDRPAAARQMRRALTSGGRLAISAWRPDEDIPVLLSLRRVAEPHLGPVTDRRHGFGDVAALEALLRGAGFQDVCSRIDRRTARFDDGLAFVRLNALALIGMRAESAAMADSERARLADLIADDSADIVRAHTDATGFAVPLAATVATASAGG